MPNFEDQLDLEEQNSLAPTLVPPPVIPSPAVYPTPTGQPIPTPGANGVVEEQPILNLPNPNYEPEVAPVVPPNLTGGPTEVIAPAAAVSPKPVPISETSTSTTSKLIPTAGEKVAVEDLIKAADDESRATVELEKDAIDKAKQAQVIKDEEIALAQTRQAEVKDLENTHIKAYEDSIKNYDAKVAELENSDYKGFWADRSTGDKILAAVSIFAGGFAGSLGKTPNYALQIIDNAMEADFNKYKVNLDKQIKQIDALKIGTDMKKALIDQRTQQAAARYEAGIGVTAAKLEQIKSQVSDQAAKARIDLAKAQLDQKKIQIKKDYEAKQATQQQNSFTTQLASLTSPKNQEKYVPGLGYTYKKEQADKLNDQVIAKKSVDRTITDLRQNVQDLQTLNPLTNASAYNKAKTNVPILVSKMRATMGDKGAWSDQDRARMEEAIGDPTSFLNLVAGSKWSGINEKLKLVEGLVNDTHKDTIHQFIAVPDVPALNSGDDGKAKRLKELREKRGK